MRHDLGHLKELAERHHSTHLTTPDDVRAALQDMFAAYADQVIADPLTETAYFELSLMGSRDPDLAAVLADTQKEYQETVASMLSSLAAAVDGRWEAPVLTVTEQAVALLYGASTTWLMHRDDALFREVLADSAATLARRLHIRPPT